MTTQTSQTKLSWKCAPLGAQSVWLEKSKINAPNSWGAAHKQGCFTDLLLLLHFTRWCGYSQCAALHSSLFFNLRNKMKLRVWTRQHTSALLQRWFWYLWQGGAASYHFSHVLPIKSSCLPPLRYGSSLADQGSFTWDKPSAIGDHEENFSDLKNLRDAESKNKQRM